MSDGPDDGNSQPNPFNPFGGLPFFADIAKAMAGAGPLNWDLAQQFAAMAAAGDIPDTPPDPSVRFAFNDLALVADMQVRDVSALTTTSDGTQPEFLPVTRSTWSTRTLQDFRPLFTDLATSLSQRPTNDDAPTDDPMMAMLGNLTAMMTPALLGMAIGSMVGSMAQRAFGQYDLPLPRNNTRDILLLPSNIDAFAADWSLNVADVRMWVLIHELTSHAVLNTPAVDEGISSLIRRHVAAFKPDPTAIADRLAEVDPSQEDSFAEIQNMFSDPTLLIGAVRSHEQELLAPVLDAHVLAVIGYMDHIVDAVSARVLGSSSTIAEAIRRRRLETGKDTMFVEKLLGLNLTREQLATGHDFVAGIVERAGDDSRTVLQHLVATPANLPTPNEIVAPGLWMARLNLD